MSNASLATGATAAVDASARQQPTNAPAEGEFTVTVYASSSSVVAESYCTASYALGKAMAARGWVQVNGGGGGLMGECTSGAVDAGGVVECVILRQFLANKAKAPFRRVLVLDSMVDRRAGLYESANAFVALPGGLGTLEEVAEVISWRQLEYHSRIVVLLNTDGFYSGLWSFIERGMEEGFIAKGISTCVKKADTVEECVRVIEDYKAVRIHKNGALSGGPQAVHRDGSLSGRKADWIPTDPK